MIRISHGVGLPRQVPDILGLAIKVVDAHGPGHDQDVLLASTGSGRVGRHLLWPTRRITDVTLSSILPYDVDGERAALVARAMPGSPQSSYADVCRGDANAVPVFGIRLGGAEGPLLATVVAEEAVPPEVGEPIAYDPWNTGAQLRPVGWLNALRRPTYRASQRGRRAAVIIPEDGR